MFKDWIWPVLKSAVSSAEEGSAVIEVLLCIGIFFIPTIWRRLFGFEENQPDELSIRKILIWKFFTQIEWRIGVSVIAFFLLHLLIVSPYDVYKEKNQQWMDATNQISQLSAKLQANTVNDPDTQLKRDIQLLTGEIFDSVQSLREKSNSEPSPAQIVFDNRFRERVNKVYHALDERGLHSDFLDQFCANASFSYSFVNIKPEQAVQMADELMNLELKLK